MLQNYLPMMWANALKGLKSTIEISSATNKLSQKEGDTTDRSVLKRKKGGILAYKPVAKCPTAEIGEQSDSYVLKKYHLGFFLWNSDGRNRTV